MLLSDDATIMLASLLGAGGEEWLESLVYFLGIMNGTRTPLARIQEKILSLISMVYGCHSLSRILILLLMCNPRKP